MIPRTREALTHLLERTFPSDQDIDASTVDAFVDALMKVKVESVAHDAATTAPLTSSGPNLIYRLRATHARRTPVTSVFRGETEVVRVSLPQDKPRTFVTAIGDVLPENNFLPTVSAVRERFGERIGRPFDRVELLTPPRSSGVRFSPMSIYLGYENNVSQLPLFVVFEPGTATGQPMALYLAVPYDAVVEEPAGYQPTPLSSADYWYTGGLRMQPNGRDPEALYMRAAKERGGDPYLRLHVTYEVLDSVPFQLPAAGLVEAALRMMAIQKSIVPDQGMIERLPRELGLRAIPWIDLPDNGPAASVSAPSEFTPAVAFDGFVNGLAEGERRTRC